MNPAASDIEAGAEAEMEAVVERVYRAPVNFDTNEPSHQVGFYPLGG